MTGDQGQFDSILLNLLSQDNENRTKAEKDYEQIPLGTKLGCLLPATVNNALNEEVRLLAAVLLRKLIANEFENFYPHLPVEGQTELKQRILLAIQQDSNPNIHKKICDVAAELARNLIDDDGNNHWPEYLKFLFDCANAESKMLKESSLLMFSSVPGIFGNQQARYLDVIRQMLTQNLQDQVYEVRIAAVKATTAFLLAHDKEKVLHKHFLVCLPAMLQILAESMEKEDETVLTSFVDLAESCPKILRNNLDQLLEICIKIISEASLGDSCRHLALEIIVTMSETAPAMVRKIGAKHIAVIVPLIFNMMADLDEIKDWSTSDEITEDDNDSNPVVGESSLDRLACALGGKTILPLVVNSLSGLLSSSNWMHRHAALMAVSAIGEGCHQQMETLLPQIVEGVLPYLHDPHPRVRYATCNCLGQMASDFAPIFEKKFHSKVIPSLLHLLDDGSHPRVQSHAGAALVNFFEDCPKNILSTYLDSIILKLEMILNSKFKELVEKGTKLVLEQVVVTLAAVADTAEENFAQYYDRFMPCLKYIILNANTPELRLLRGKTIECVSLIGLAVGKEKFIADASDIMDMLLKTQMGGNTMSDDDPQLSYMISAWARICKILGKQFEPYLPCVMGPVLKAASVKPEIALLDSDDMKVVEGDEDWEFVSLGDQQNFGIRTAGLEEKATACQMLVCYARELKEGFVPYAEEVVKIMVPMLKFYFHDGVRVAAAECLPSLLECAKLRGQLYLEEMWRYICPELIKAIDSEPEKEVLSEHMHYFAKCVESLGYRCVSDENLQELIKILDKALKEHFERAQERHEKRKDEDYDDMVEETLLDEDDEDVYLLSKISDVLHSLFSIYKQDFLPYFEHIIQHFVVLLAPERPAPDRQWAICVFDDVIEHGGPACIKYQEMFLGRLMASMSDESPEVRQASCYGIGVLGQFGGDAFGIKCAESLPFLYKIIEDQDSREPENINATENAISAVTKILAYNSSQVAVDTVLPQWLNWLPVWEDADEAPHIYGFLCTLLEQNHPALLGDNNCNLPRIVMVMAESFARDVLTEDCEVRQRMINLLRYLQGNAEVFSACASQLSQQQQEALQAVLVPK